MPKFEYSRLMKCGMAKCGVVGQFYLNIPLISMWKMKSFYAFTCHETIVT
jgi:hypothetical protein